VLGLALDSISGNGQWLRTDSLGLRHQPSLSVTGSEHAASFALLGMGHRDGIIRADEGLQSMVCSA